MVYLSFSPPPYPIPSTSHPLLLYRTWTLICADVSTAMPRFGPCALPHGCCNVRYCTRALRFAGSRRDVPRFALFFFFSVPCAPVWQRDVCARLRGGTSFALPRGAHITASFATHSGPRDHRSAPRTLCWQSKETATRGRGTMGGYVRTARRKQALLPFALLFWMLAPHLNLGNNISTRIDWRRYFVGVHTIPDLDFGDERKSSAVLSTCPPVRPQPHTPECATFPPPTTVPPQAFVAPCMNPN